MDKKFNDDLDALLEEASEVSGTSEISDNKTIAKSSEKISEKRIINNLEFFGFDNPKLNSIIGGEEWETYNYPHLPRKEREEKRKCILNKGVYFKVYDDYLAIEFWESDVIGKYMFKQILSL